MVEKDSVKSGLLVYLWNVFTPTDWRGVLDLTSCIILNLQHQIVPADKDKYETMLLDRQIKMDWFYLFSNIKVRLKLL